MKTSRKTFLTLLFLSIFFSTNVYSQVNKEKKIYETVRVKKAPKIDGVLNDEAWKKAPIATDFIVLYPDNGSKAYNETQARIIYDDKAIYIGAYMHEQSRDSVRVYLSNRDEMGGSDYFGILINPFNDGQTFARFFVTSAGVQWDYNGSKSWDAVYKTAVQVTDSGWVAEMEIPFSALRFPKESQDWAFNLIRYHSHYSGESSWSFIDRNISNTNSQLGILRGIKDVEPPVRLSFSPYFSSYFTHNGEKKKWTTDIKGGVDLKYGINESFTLDMMLIPDFGQVESDDIVQNLSPYETYYQEKRQFFTENLDLFSRGDLFYSRRIGNKPRNFYNPEDELLENEIVSENPAESKLINATKISGKTKNGFGIGFLNAMTKPMEAEILDTINDRTRTLNTQAFTNYNVSVIEKTLKNNSFVSLINTNVISPADHFSADVIGSEFEFYDKNINYNISGYLAYSRVKEDNESDAKTGIKYRVHIGKEKGNFRWGMARNAATENYDQNDLGYFRKNNYIQHAISLSHNITKPSWIVKEWYSEFFAEHNKLYDSQAYVSSMINLYTGGLFKNNIRLNNSFFTMLTDEKDFFEPRSEGHVFCRAKYYEYNNYFATDSRKRFVYRQSFNYYNAPRTSSKRYYFDINPTLQISDRCNIEYLLEFNNNINNFGYVEDDESTDDIIFGRRNRKVIENSVSLNYIFNNKSALNFRLRHYSSATKYKEFYKLEQNGDLTPITYFSDEHNSTFNTFNIDLVYRWEFAPGSELSLVWKNAIFEYDEGKYEKNYFTNVNNLLKSPQHNSFSLKILYYLDWQYLKKHH